jgi:hypothetical protein
MPDDFPCRNIQYGNTKGVLRQHPAWQALTHFFNHQAHHSGQVTTGGKFWGCSRFPVCKGAR